MNRILLIMGTSIIDTMPWKYRSRYLFWKLIEKISDFSYFVLDIIIKFLDYCLRNLWLVLLVAVLSFLLVKYLKKTEEKASIKK